MTQEVLSKSNYHSKHPLGDGNNLQLSIVDLVKILSKYGWILITVTIVASVMSAYYAYTKIYSPFSSELLVARTENVNNQKMAHHIERFKETIINPKYSGIFVEQLSKRNASFSEKLKLNELTNIDLFPIASKGGLSSPAVSFYELAANNSLMVRLDLPFQGLGDSMGYDIVESINSFIDSHNADLVSNNTAIRSRIYTQALSEFKTKENDFLKLKERIDPALAELNMAMARINFELFSKIKSHNRIIDQFLSFPGSIHIHDYFQKNNLTVEEYQSLSIHTIRILGALVESKSLDKTEANTFLSKYTEIKTKISELESQHFKAEDDFKNAKAFYTKALKKIQASGEEIQTLILPKLALIEGVYKNSIRNNQLEKRDNSKKFQTIFGVTCLVLVAVFIFLLIFENYRFQASKLNTMNQ